MRKTLVVMLLVVLAVFFAGTAMAASFETQLYPTVSYFTWKEFSTTSGAQVVKETGVLYGIGGTGRLEINPVFAKLNSELFYGPSIKYNGQTWGGDPASTHVDYFGGKMSLDVGPTFSDFPIAGLRIDPFIGIGSRVWLRDLKDTGNVQGYTEGWITLVGRAGLSLNYKASNTINLFATGGAQEPFYTRNHADLTDVTGSVETTKPKGAVSAFGELGVKWRFLHVAAFYEGLRFKQSPVNGDGFVQPKSSMDIVGGRIGFSF